MAVLYMTLLITTITKKSYYYVLMKFKQLACTLYSAFRPPLF